MDNNSHLPRPSRCNNQRTSIPATTFASTYRSTHVAEKANEHLLPNLSHVNCSYLSTPGVAPSLIQLKQHAQSLAVLIKSLTLSTQPVMIDSANVQAQASLQGEHHGSFPLSPDGQTWDWLNDLTKPYKGPANPKLHYHHSLPLTSILNVLEPVSVANSTGGGKHLVRETCPLYSAEAHLTKNPNASALPYARHQTLLAHANEVLELLDHDYSAKGGLLSILPPTQDVEGRAKAESTLLGQYILYTQRLVLRLHELEREYANALDVLKGEAEVPLQMLSRLGLEGRKGREVAYPQDKFVLVNAGEDVWNFLDREFSDRESVGEAVRQNDLAHGVTGERLWEDRDGKEFARGVTAIDITTRYFRLREDALKTIFMIPAWGEHPGVNATKEMEKKPIVVSVVPPTWPERHSLWEQRNRSKLAELHDLRENYAPLKEEVVAKEGDITFLNLEYEKKAQEVRDLQKRIGVLEKDESNEKGRDIYEKYTHLAEREAQVDAAVKAAQVAAEGAEKRALIALQKIVESEQQLDIRRRALVEKEKTFEKRRKRKLDELEILSSKIAKGGKVDAMRMQESKREDADVRASREGSHG